MNPKIQKKYQIAMHICTAVGLIGAIIFFIYAYKAGILTSEEAMKNFLVPFGFWAPLIFVVIQAVQVVIPILPGAIGCVIGVVMFGPWLGFLYNYIGICLGSEAAFLLAKMYGKPLLELVASPKLYKKYLGWLDRNQKHFDKLFTAAIFLPVAPDDFLCFLAGVTHMKLKKFTAVILLGKPLAIALYSLGLELVLQKFLGLLG